MEMMASLMPYAEIGESTHELRRVRSILTVSGQRGMIQRTFPFTASRPLTWCWGSRLIAGVLVQLSMEVAEMGHGEESWMEEEGRK